MSNRNYEIITWSRTFSCGIKVIDEQHKELVNLVNDMFRHITGNKVQEHEYFNLIIREMINYVKVHFATEEKIMETFKFPGYEEHKKAHGNFIFTVIYIVQDYQSGKKHTLNSIYKFLKNWILSHIALMDKQYFDYFFKIASHKANGKLTLRQKMLPVLGEAGVLTPA